MPNPAKHQRHHRKHSTPIIIWVIPLMLLSACSIARDAIPAPTIAFPIKAQIPTPEPTVPTILPSSIPIATTPHQITPSLNLSKASPLVTTSPVPTVIFAYPILPKQTPVETSDLLFLSSQSLMRWDYVTRYTGLLVEGVSDFSVSSSGKKIALLRPQNITANGVDLFSLDILDLETKQIIPLLQSVPQLKRIKISPDGKYIAYLMHPQGGEIYYIATTPPTQPTELGKCEYTPTNACQDLAWSHDSKSIAWSDAKGAWISTLGNSIPILIHPNHVFVTDPKGNKTQVDVTLDSMQWSPIGRFILVRIVTQTSNVTWRGILDTGLRRLVEVPDSFETGQPNNNAYWLRDGNLLVFCPGDANTHSPALIKHWLVIPTNNNLLVMDHQMEIQPSTFPNLFPGSLLLSKYDLEFVDQWGENLYTIKLNLTGVKASSVLFTLDLYLGNTAKMLEIPFEVRQILWSPDKNGALILGKQNQIYFISLLDQEILDFSQLVGSDLHHFQWLPPAPRS